MRFCEGVAYVTLSRGLEAKIDLQDVALVAPYNWYASTDNKTGLFYARRAAPKVDGLEKSKIRLHRAIMNPPHGMTVDHVNSDGLDCRRSNMRVASTSQNAHNSRKSKSNTSGFKGVYFHKASRKWMAQIQLLGGKFYLGLHPTANEAYVAYCEASKDLHGAFGRTS
jgi:hypothetical protein